MTDAADTPDFSDVDLDDDRPVNADIERIRSENKARAALRLISQLDTINLAEDVKDRLESLIGPKERGAILDAAVVKLGLDILSGNLEPRTLAEASKAIEALAHTSTLVSGGNAHVTFSSSDRMAIFERVRETVALRQDDLPQSTKDAIEAEYREG